MDGFKRAQKGFICLAMANAYAPWFISPDQALAPVMSVGVGKLLIASRNLVLGRMFVRVIVSPAKLTVS